VNEEAYTLTVPAVARILDVSPTSVKRWVAQGRLPCLRTPGGHRRFRRSDVDAFAGKNLVAASRPSNGDEGAVSALVRKMNRLETLYECLAESLDDIARSLEDRGVLPRAT
jgi:excisionase family DNA binding protein